MHKRILIIVILSAAAAGVTTYATTADRSERPDCPGQIVCPLTGEPVCADRCPLSKLSVHNHRSALPACCRNPG